MLIANYLYVAVISGYYKKQDWQAWADKIIISNNNLDIWIYDVSMAQNKEELYKSIGDRKREEYFEKETFFSEADVVIGYYYLMFKEGKMNLSELIFRLNDEDDSAVDAVICGNKRFKKLLNKINRSREQKYTKFIQKLDEILNPLVHIAQQQQQVIKNYLINEEK